MKKNIKCFIIDDEPDSRELIKKFVARVPYLELIGEFSNAIDAIFLVNETRPDLIFLDVEMPEMNGFEFIRTLKIYRPKIIMVTAYPHYALDGFQHEVTDYLLKPISFELFFRAVNKVADAVPIALASPISTDSEKNGKELSQQTSYNEPNKTPPFLLVKVDKKFVRIEADEIVYIESMKDYIKIHLMNKTMVTHGTMTKMETMLPEGWFVRISRSFLLRLSAISELNGNQITTSNGKKIDIGLTFRASVLEAMRKNIY